MLSGSAFLRVILLLVAVAVLAGVVQHFIAQSTDDKDSSRAEVTRPTSAQGTTVREIPTPPQPNAALARPAAEPAPSEAAQALTAPATRQNGAPETPPPEPAQDQALARPPNGKRPDAGEVAASNPTAATDEGIGDLVDLNTGTLAQLNGLRGGGAIGRAIIQRRPYSSVEQLLTKRVLSRSTFRKIKDQVTVR